MTKTALALLVAAVVPIIAQDTSLRFEVASIKPAGAAVRGVAVGPTGFLPGGRYAARNITPGQLLVLAFREDGADLRPEQIVGAPSWLASTHYNIDAKVAGPETARPIVDPEAAGLLRSLLVDRFNLNFHYEQRELPFYALVVAKTDGSLGASLKPSTLECDAIIREREAARLANRRPAVPARVGGQPTCAVTRSRERVLGSGATMTTLASVLTGAVGSTVLDRTRLTGSFDFELHFAPDSAGAAANVTNADAPSLFTALPEQLGLKLDMRREMGPVLVIDHVEPPKPN